MSESIFKLDQAFVDILDEIEEAGGEITEEIGEQLNRVEGDMNNKFRGYTYAIRKLQGDCNTIDGEIERLTALKQVKTNTIKRLEKVLLYFLPKYGEEVKVGQGFKSVIDLGDIKLENKFTKPLIVTDDFVNTIQDLIINKLFDITEVEFEDEEEKDIGIANIEENTHRYASVSIPINKVSDYKLMRHTITVLNKLGFEFKHTDVKVNINKVEIKKDIKSGKKVYGAIIDENHATLTIK